MAPTITPEVLTRHHVHKNDDPFCSAILDDGEGTYICTRRDRHARHEAYDGTAIVAEWTDEEIEQGGEQD